MPNKLLNELNIVLLCKYTYVSFARKWTIACP